LVYHCYHMHEYLGGTTNKIRKSCQVSSVSIRLRTDAAFHQLVFLLPRLWSGLLAWFIGFCLFFLICFSMLSLSKITRRWLHLGDLECGFLSFVQVHGLLWMLTHFYYILFSIIQSKKFCPRKTSISKAQEPFSYVDFLFVLDCKN